MTSATHSKTNLTLPELESLASNRLTTLFDNYFNAPNPAPNLQTAMAYCVRNGGKRIRPLLVYAVGISFGAVWEACDVPAAAIEFIHAYSLTHDDLPAMDNADLRRGKPSCHKQYNEVIAILAGDTLQTLAFELLANHPAPLSTEQRLAMIKTLAKASGYEGMGAGQTLDMQGMTTLDDIERMYRLKTGALLQASVELGALAANITDKSLTNQLKQFAVSISLAFQIQDDLLDLQSEQITGKTHGCDAANNKITYAGLLGIEKTQKKITELFASALESVNALGSQGILLHQIAQRLINRKN